MKLTMSSVPTEWQYATVRKPAFNLDSRGFESQWWDIDVRPATRNRDEFYRWTINDVEVARAHVQLDTEIDGEYLRLGRIPELAHDLPFFEVHGDFRSQGIGLEAVRQLETKYSDRILTAFSEQADHFWTKAGWLHCKRADESPLYRPLFVRLPARLTRRRA